MYGVELYAAVRLAVVDEGLSHHEAGRRFGIDRRTVKKMLSYSAPPGYRRTKPVRRPKLDGFTGIVDAILEADTDPDVPRKQRHTAHRIFERLRDEHGFTGGYTIVKDYVRSRRQSTREAFVPLHHPPGHAQVDFGEAVVELRGQREKVAFFCLILPHSNLWFVKAYPRETTEAFLDGHVSAFAFLGGVPRSILYDNTTLAVARILGDGTRRRTQAFSHLQSHYLFRDRFGRPGKGNDKGKVEALVKTARRRFMVPIPKVHDLSVLNERLMARCLERLDALEQGDRATAVLGEEHVCCCVSALLALDHDNRLCWRLEDSRQVVERPRCRHRPGRPLLAPNRKPAPRGRANNLAPARVVGLPPGDVEGELAVRRVVEPDLDRFARCFLWTQPRPIHFGRVDRNRDDRLGILALIGRRGALGYPELDIASLLKHAVDGAGHDGSPSMRARARAASD